MKEIFNYIAPFMGEIVIITLKTPDTSRVNQYFSEQRKLFLSGADSREKIDVHRKAFFDELFLSAEVTSGDTTVAFGKEGVTDSWKEHAVLSAFETLGKIKN